MKPDQLIKRRGKLGLVGVNLDLNGVREWLKPRLMKETTVRHPPSWANYLHPIPLSESVHWTLLRSILSQCFTQILLLLPFPSPSREFSTEAFGWCCLMHVCLNSLLIAEGFSISLLVVNQSSQLKRALLPNKQSVHLSSQHKHSAGHPSQCH